jgi:hypothetical protein
MDEQSVLRQIEEELCALRHQISDLGDRSTLERLAHHEKPVRAPPPQSIFEDELPLAEKTSRLCSECLEKEDLDAAFLAILRYIEAVAKAKADSEEISERATREYVERRFDDVVNINTDRLATASTRLHAQIESRIRRISDDFDEFAQSIHSRLIFADSQLAVAEQVIAQKAGKIVVKRKSMAEQLKSGAPKPKARHVVKLRKDGIVYPPKANLPVEPAMEALQPAVMTVSMRDAVPKSLLVTSTNQFLR